MLPAITLIARSGLVSARDTTSLVLKLVLLNLIPNHAHNTQKARFMGSVAAFLLLLGAALGAAAAPVNDLRVMSFNIWVNGGTSLTRCIDAIRTTGADIVGLQECNAATARTIATNLGFYYLGVPDVSIVSRYPILNAIPTGGGSAVAIELSPGQVAYLFNCHLAPYPYGPYSIREGRDQTFVINQEHQTRMPALNSLLAAMAPYIAGPSPCFLVGDFNAPSHLDYASYPWPTSLACDTAGLLDSYRLMHPANRTYPPAFAFDDPGITWTPRIDQEPEDAFDRIDFVFFSRGDGMTILESTDLDARNSVSPWPSDHRAVISRFTLTPSVPADYEWNFANGDLTPALGNGLLSYADGAVTSNLTTFGTSDGTTVPHIAGYPTRYMGVPAFTSSANGYHVTLNSSAPNGGGAYINQFTIIFDLLIPAPLGWTPLFNTNPQNANDADFFVDANGRVGTGAIGYSPNGVIASNTWHRIAFAANFASNTVTYYVDGQPVFTGAASLDGRHSLYSSLDPGPDLLLFNEGDPAGIFTHTLYLSSVAFTHRTMPAAEIQALGAPNDLGIFKQSLPALSITRNGNELQLTWPGGPAMRLQKSTTLAPPWLEISGTTGASSFTDSLTDTAAFYRLTR